MPWTPSFPGTGQGDQGFRPDRVGPVRRSRNPPPVGLGIGPALESRKVTGFALAQDGQVVHLSVFDQPKNEEEGPRFSRMGSFSNRRRNWE